MNTIKRITSLALSFGLICTMQSHAMEPSHETAAAAAPAKATSLDRISGLASYILRASYARQLDNGTIKEDSPEDVAIRKEINAFESIADWPNEFFNKKVLPKLRRHFPALNKIIHTVYQPTRIHHPSEVSSAKYSPDGKHIVTTYQDKGTIYQRDNCNAYIWNSITGTRKHTLTGHTNTVLSAAYSPDGAHIVTASADRTACIWNSATGALEHTLEGHTNCVYSASYSPNGKHIITASADRTACIWDSATGTLEYPLMGHTNCVNSASYSPDGKHIITASEDNTVCIWNSTFGTLEHKLKRHTNSVKSATYSPDGAHIVTASYDGTARIWNSITGILEHTLGVHADGVRSAAYSPDGDHIITVSCVGDTDIWNSNTGKLKRQLGRNRFLFRDRINSAAYSPNSNHIVISSKDSNSILILNSDKNLYPEQILFLFILEGMNPQRDHTINFKQIADNFPAYITEKELITIMARFPDSVQKNIIKEYRIDNTPSPVIPEAEQTVTPEPEHTWPVLSWINNHRTTTAAIATGIAATGVALWRYFKK